MGIELIALYPFQNVVATGLAVVDLANLLGFNIETLYLQLGGTTFTKSMIATAQLKANGKTILDSTGSAIDTRMQWRGLSASATFLPIDFTEVRGRSKNALLSGSLDTTVGIKSLRLEVGISGATAPTLAGYAAVSAPLVAPEFAAIRPLIARVHRFTQVIGAAGTFGLQVPHLDPAYGGSLFKRICVFSANMTGLKVIRNGITEHESVAALNNFRCAYEGLRTSQTSFYPFDPIVDNFQEDRVFDTRPASGTTTTQILGTFSAGETITIESEVLEPLDAY